MLEVWEFFRIVVATPLLALICVIATVVMEKRKGATVRQRGGGAYVAFASIGVCAFNLLYLSYDERAFGDEFGLYLYVFLPVLAVIAISGCWCAVRALRSEALDRYLKPMSAVTLLFLLVGMYGATFGWFPPGYELFVNAYVAVSLALATLWFRRHRRTRS